MIQNESSQLVNGSFLHTKPVYRRYEIMHENTEGIISIDIELGMHRESK